MASPAAQAAYNALPPDQKARVDATTAGNPNGIDDWYNASVASGDPTHVAAGVRGAATGKSEDFARFDNATIAGWNQFYDAAASAAAGRPQYKSSRGAAGFYDKPTECPAGQSPNGPDESSPCEDNSVLLARQGAGTAAGAAAAAPSDGLLRAPAPGTGDPALDDLQRSLEDQFLGRAHIFGMADSRDPNSGNAPDLAGQPLQGGGLWWGSDATMFDPTNGATPAAPAATAAPARAASAVPEAVAPVAPVAAAPIAETPLQQSLIQKEINRKGRKYNENGVYGGGQYGGGSDWMNSIPGV